ncbi:MAG: ATP-binding cassette domain-containing protein, partial [Caulobacteraceae bacterium]
ARFRADLGEDDAATIDQMAVRAAETCGAHETIVRLAEGYGAMLGLGGRGLSAGQAQRVAMARALFGEPKVLILDEPNAHLDNEGEAALVRTLVELKTAGTTILVAAHRTGVLAAVDKLMVLKEGRIDLFGPRDEVIRRIGGAIVRQPTPFAHAAA